MPSHTLEPLALPGIRWHSNGQSTFSGNMLDLYRILDRLFLKWSEETGAEEHWFPVFIEARELDKIGYFQSFPHLVTFPVVLDGEESNLRHFSNAQNPDSDGEITLARVMPVKDVLAPAACYHFYVHFQGEDFSAPRYLTTLARCCRRESQYLPLERQWNFSMREIVCLGSAEEVKSFLARLQGVLHEFFSRVGLPIEWKNATDPFFDPSRNPKYLAQRLDPVKTEMVFGGTLAIGSVNFHRNYFGEAFRIARDGKEAFSGCVAFGLERWMYAILAHFGPDPSDWPAL